MKGCIFIANSTYILMVNHYLTWSIRCRGISNGILEEEGAQNEWKKKQSDRSRFHLSPSALRLVFYWHFNSFYLIFIDLVCGVAGNERMEKVCKECFINWKVGHESIGWPMRERHGKMLIRMVYSPNQSVKMYGLGMFGGLSCLHSWNFLLFIFLWKDTSN